MLKNILNLDGAQKLTKNEQKSINGGNEPAEGGSNCGEYKIVTATQTRCLAYPISYRPVYLGSNRCSILMPPC